MNTANLFLIANLSFVRVACGNAALDSIDKMLQLRKTNLLRSGSHCK